MRNRLRGGLPAGDRRAVIIPAWVIILAGSRGHVGLATLAHGAGALTALAVARCAVHLRRARLPARWAPSRPYRRRADGAAGQWLTDRLCVRRALGLARRAGLPGGERRFAPCSRSRCRRGFSVLSPATGKAIVEWFPPRERGLGMGIKQTGLTLGILSASLALPPIALAWGWRRALAVAGTVSLLAGILVLAAYRRPAHLGETSRAERPRLGELAQFLRRRDVLVVFGCGLLLSIVQSSVLAYLTLYAHDTFGVSAVAQRPRAGAGRHGTLAWGWISDHSFGGGAGPASS
jgi:hypothetical protein